MKKPFLIIIDGPMGSGKTSVANLLRRRMHKDLGFTALISLDRLKRIVSEYKMDSKTHLKIASEIGIVMVREYLKKGINVIVEKAFTRAEFVDSFIKPFKKKSHLFVYQVEAPIDIRTRRVKERPLHTEVKKRPPKSKILRNTQHYLEFRYKKAKIFDSSKLTSQQIVNRIIKDIK